MENITLAERNKKAAIYGLLLGIIHVIISSAVNLTVSNMNLFYWTRIAGGIAFYVFLGVFADRIRSANGGYIEFRELFGAIFIMILIAGFISYIYYYLYINVIDTDFLNKMKAGMMSAMEKTRTPDKTIEDAATKFDKRIAESKHFNLWNNVLNYFAQTIGDSLIGLLICLIVRKSKPMVA